MADSLSDAKFKWYAAMLGYNQGTIVGKSLNDLEYEFFAAGPIASPPNLSQAQVESPASTVYGLVSGQRINQAVMADLKALPGWGTAGAALRVNTAGTGMEWKV